ncbi:MAG: Gfo/Idh/MocA family oxidoreductase [bacterium]
MSKYNVSIIGCGDIGFRFDRGRDGDGALTHFKAFNDDKRFDVVSVCEISKTIREEIEQEFKIPAYEDLETMLSDYPADVIVVATNDDSHYGILNKILKFKPKLVFCEKPLALNTEDVESIIELYKKNKIHLQVNYTRRFLDEFIEIESIVKERKIGELESITFYYSRGLTHNASHYLDLVNWYIGETEKNLIKVSRKVGISEEDDTVSFDMIFANGPEVRFIGLNPSKLSFAEVDFIGSKGRVKVNYKNEIEKFSVTENKLFKGYSAYQLDSVARIRFEKALPNAVNNIFEVLEGKEKLRSPSENSIKVFELINRIKEKELCLN